MTSVNEAIKSALCLMLANRGTSIIKVTSWEEETHVGGYCETCAYEETVVKIHYVDGDYDDCTYTWSGSFAELIQTLTREDPNA